MHELRARDSRIVAFINQANHGRAQGRSHTQFCSKEVTMIQQGKYKGTTSMRLHFSHLLACRSLTRTSMSACISEEV
eukprot:1158671-Pelagomonas_calceolata.AAC.11